MNGRFEDGLHLVVACNFDYQEDYKGDLQFMGRAYFMYASIQLAELAVGLMDRLRWHDRQVRVMISKRRLECRRTMSHLMVGQSRWGEDLFRCFSARRH